MDVPPIPLDLVLSGRDVTEPRLSPDGSAVAFVQRRRGSAAVMVIHGLDTPNPVPERPLSFGPDPAPGRGLGGGAFAWLGSGIVYAAADGELWSIDGAALVQVTAHERSCRAPDVAVVGGAPVVAYAVDEAEIWLTDLASGRHRRIDDGRHEFCFDPVIAPDGSIVSWQAWSPPDMPWDAAVRVDARLEPSRLAVAQLTVWSPDGGAVQQPRFAPDGGPTCVHDATGWLRVCHGDRTLEDGPVEQAGPTWGMGQRSYAVTEDGAILVARNDRGFGGLCVAGVDGSMTELAGPGHVYGQLSVTRDRLVALRSGPTSPGEVVQFPRTRAGEFEGPSVVAHSGVPAWEQIDMPRPDVVEADVDGTTVHARRYVAGHGRMLCWVHGGPTDQWQVDFRPRLAYWWSRGWDVLVVDPRGTTGHGRAYQRALNGFWGRLDVDDTAALVAHAHRRGWARPATTVVIGGSSGGLTVLGVLADHADLVAGGVASYPVSDLGDLAEVTHRFEAHYTDTLVGPIDDTARFRELSPIHRADRIDGPLLLFHGSEDPVVPAAQSALLADRVTAAGGDVEHVVYEGEGHGFRDPEHQRDEYERTERFLDRIVAASR